MFRFKARGKEVKRLESDFIQLWKAYFHTRYGLFYFVLRWLICPFREMERSLPQKGKIVDVGCGEGVFSNYLSIRSSERQVVGIDKDLRKIQIAQQSKIGQRNIHFLNYELQEIREDGLSAIVMSDFLHHIPYSTQEKLLREAYLHLKDGGILLLKEINKSISISFLFSQLAEWLLYFRQPIYYRSKKELVSLLEHLGFKVIVRKVLNLFSTYLFICKKRCETRPMT